MVLYKNEKEFQKDYVRELKDEWYWVYKLPDIWYTLKPFDIVAVKDGIVYWIELKYWNVDEYDKIYKMLRPNQVGWLKHLQEHWGKSLIVWRDKKTEQVFQYDFIYKKYEWQL